MKGRHEISFGRSQIMFQLRRSDRRTLGITVLPDMSVWVTAPRQASLEKVMAKVRKRVRWILRQQRFFAEFLPPMPPRKYLSGETHRYLGRQYRLKVVENGTLAVKLKGRFLWVHTSQKRDTARVRRLVQGWYLARARERFARSLAESAERLGRWLDHLPQIQLRRMPKRWGSWTRRGVIWLNPELVKAPASCIDYVVTHELCHIVHAHHGAEFFRLLQQAMPDWELRKNRLERMAAEGG